jgi:hypothetical protein
MYTAMFVPSQRHSAPGEHVEFLSLPSEVLLHIFSFLPSNDLGNLSFLCKRLHYLALPLHLSLCGIDHPLELSSGTVSLSNENAIAISALRLAMFVTSIKRFEFTFGVGIVSSEGLLREIRSIKRLLATVRVKEIVLDFRHIVLLRTKKRFGVGLEFHGTVMNRKKWYSVLGKLLKTLGAMEGTALTVLAGRTFMPIYEGQAEITRLDLPAATPGTLPSWLSTPDTTTVEHRTPPDSPSGVDPLIQFAEFHVQSALFFQQPFLDWTIAALRSSSIVALSFEQLNLSYDSWTDLLTGIALPNVTEFSVASCNLSFINLSTHFLYRHPHVSNLNFCDSSMRRNPDFPSPILLHPELDVLMIRCSTITLTPFSDQGYVALDRVLYQLAGFPQHLVGKFISLHILIHASKSFADSLWSILDGFPSRVSYSLPFVTNIMIDECLEPSLFSQNVMPMLPRWFQVFFPRLKHVTLGRNCYPLEAVDEVAVTHELAERCPGCVLDFVR